MSNKKSLRGYSKLKVFNNNVLELFSKTPEEYLASVDDNDINDVYPLDPIDAKEMLVGRSELLEKSLSHLSLPGRHLAVYGHRGIGKTSFSNVIQNFHNNESHFFDKTIYKSCSDETSLQELFGELIWESNRDYFKSTHVENRKKNWSFDIGKILKFFGLQLGRDQEEEHTYKIEQGKLTPARIAESLQDFKILFVIDELERVKKSSKLCTDLADLLKKLSDLKSNFKLICVGIAYSKKKLFRSHKSIDRQTLPIHLKPVKDLSEIFKIGQQKSGVEFRKEVRNEILNSSLGFPYFVKLQAFHCLKEAKKDKDKVKFIDENIYKRAITNLTNDQDEEVLEKLYSIHKFENDQIMLAIPFLAAKLHTFNFGADDIQIKYEEYFDVILKEKSIVKRLVKLSENHSYSMFNHVGDGIYSFRNIRSKIYLNIKSYNAFNNSLAYTSKDLVMLNRYLKKAGITLNDREFIENKVEEIRKWLKNKESEESKVFKKTKKTEEKKKYKPVSDLHNFIDNISYINPKTRSNIHSSISNFLAHE